jgi:hypothetical protein
MIFQELKNYIAKITTKDVAGTNPIKNGKSSYQASARSSLAGGFSQQGASGRTPQSGIRNSLGISFESSGGTIAATFSDGSSIVMV